MEGESKEALRKLDEAILALEAEGYEFSQKSLHRRSICDPQGSKTKQVIEVRCYKYLPAEEMPPDFAGLKGFSTGGTC
jgi:hypothetical protein